MNQIDLFDKYLKQELSSEECTNFELNLKRDEELAQEFYMYLAVVKGICQEAEQDNRDFGEALKHISREELLKVIGRAEKKNQSQSADIKSRSINYRRWLIWQSIGVAALVGIVVIYAVVAYNETKTIQNNALAMNQEAMYKVDNAIYAFSEYSHGTARSGGIDISKLSDEELKNYLPELEKAYNEQTDVLDMADSGSELVMVYLRLHERDKAISLLEQLIEKFKGNKDLEGEVINWETILNLIK